MFLPLRSWLLLFFTLLLTLPRIAMADDVRKVDVAVDDLLYNAADGKLYGGVISGLDINSIVPIDPQTATLGTATPLGATPRKMVVSSDGHYIYAVIAGGYQIRRFDTTTQSAGIQFGFGKDYSDLYAEDIASLPGSPNSIVVSRANTGISPRHKDIVAFDDGVLRVTPNRAAGANYIAINESGTRLYGYFAELSSFDFVRWDIDANGFSNGTVIHPISGFNVNFKYAAGRAYGSNGVIFDPESGALLGNFNSQSLGLTLPDPTTGKLFTASQSGTNLTIRAQDLTTLAPLGSILIPNVANPADHLIRWGINGLAFRAGNQVFLIRNSLVKIPPPTITAASPTQARVGESVVISGQDLLTTKTVKFNGVEAAFQVDSDTQITAVVPWGATTGLLSVTTDGGSTETLPFTVLRPTISVGDVSIPEGDSGTTNLTFTVRLSYGSNEIVSFDYATVDGTAVGDADYAASTGSRSFRPGETSLTLSIPVQGDTLYEPNETFLLRLSNVIGAITEASSPLLRNSANGHFYEQVTGSLDWDRAKTAAQSRNHWGVAGHLATITSAEEDAFIASNFGNVTFWLGGIQATGSVEPSEGFGWITGEEFTYTNWDSGEPNNAGVNGEPGTTTERVDAIQRDSFNQWNDVPRATLASSYLVEYDVAPNASEAHTEATATVLNDDPLPSVFLGTATVNEGDTGTTDMKFPVSLNVPSAVPVTLDYSTADGSATADTDYSPINGTLTFNPGETTKTISVPIAGDVIDEEDETFALNISQPANATLENTTSQGTITDDDTSSLSIDNPSINEGNRGTVLMKFTLKLSTPSSRPLTLIYHTVNDQSPAVPNAATSGVDYVAVPPTSLTFAPGETSKSVSIAIKGDTERELNEQVTLFVSGTENISGNFQGNGTIMNDDGVPAISINDVTVVEGAGGATTKATFTVKLSIPTYQQVRVNYATASGSATAGSDYTSIRGTLVFAPGETSKPLTVLVRNDIVDEDKETFSMVLSNPYNASILRDRGNGSIVDDDLPPSISFASTSVALTERNSGTVPMVFTVRLSAPSAHPVQFTYQTASGRSDSATAGVDYEAIPPHVVVIPPDSTGTQLFISVKGDTAYELNEHVNLVLSRAVNAFIPSGLTTAEGTILNDDKIPSFSIGNAQIVEGNSGLKSLLFTVKLSSSSGLPASVRYATSNGTALAGSDYMNAAGTLYFATGETSVPIAVTIKGDTLSESDEQFRLILSGASGANMAGSTLTAVGTISNDDTLLPPNTPSSGDA